MSKRPNRWMASRWMILSIVFGAAVFYLAITYPGEGGIEAFTAIGSIALAGGHLTNGLRDARGVPRNPTDEEKVNL